jgi:hypothetical protein
MAALPLGSLRHAQKKLNETTHNSHDDSDSDSDSDAEPAPHSSKQKQKQKDWNLDRRSDIPHRSSKHACVLFPLLMGIWLKQRTGLQKSPPSDL